MAHINVTSLREKPEDWRDTEIGRGGGKGGGSETTSMNDNIVACVNLVLSGREWEEWFDDVPKTRSGSTISHKLLLIHCRDKIITGTTTPNSDY